MDNYTLAPDEVLLFEGSVTRKEKSGNWTLQLTTKVLVFSKTEKVGRAFHKTLETTVDLVPLSEIKIYNNEPQIKQKMSETTIQTTSGNISLSFDGMIAAIKFTNKFKEAVTGKAVSKRGSEKVKGAIGLVDDTLGIDTIGTVKGVVENGVVGTVVGGTKGGKDEKPAILEKSVEVAKNAFSGKKEKAVDKNGLPDAMPAVESESLSIDQQIEAVKKLKELLDADILTQEEFDLKKKDILGL